MSTPRTLADQLRGWSEEQLGRLLTARPDLAMPPPQDSGQLASRCGTRASVLRALEQLTHLELVVLDAVLACGGTTDLPTLRDRVNASAESVDEAVHRVRDLALVWGTDDALRTLSILNDTLGTTMSGLGDSASTLLTRYGPSRVAALVKDLGITPTGDRSADIARITELLADPSVVASLRAEVDDRARAILDHLEREGKDGSVETTDRAVSRSDKGAAPVDQLLARGLLVARDRRHVAVPREVALVLRDGHTTRESADAVPELATSARDQDLVDRAAAGAAFELVRHVELLLEHWGATPPAALRSGGLGVRDLKAVAELLHVDERVAALHVELAAAAGLLAVDATDDVDAAWLPTHASDTWAAGSVSDRWTRLALVWLDNPRLTGLVGRRVAGKTVNALAPELEHRWLAETRRRALEEVAALPAGEVLASGTGVPSLVARTGWLRPRRPAERAEAVAWAIEESAVMGLGALGGIATHGRALLGDDPAHRAPGALEPLLPQPVDHMLLQADLTAVAPGPLEHELAHNLASMADIESRGGATVYRFSEKSVRRAFDAGWSAVELKEFLAASSRTPVPQPLLYLVDDVARTFGTVRVGAAESFLRSDDESALAELMHHPKAGSLRLRRIAPTVVVSDVPVDVLLPRLRELGAAPVVEAPDGTVRLASRAVQRARTPKTRPAVDDLPVAPSPGDAKAAARFAARVAATVTAVRAGDRTTAHRSTTGPARRSTPAAVLAELREAADAKQTVTIGYVDNQGVTVDRLVDPVHVHAGQLTAYDHRSDEVRLFVVHRITTVSPISSSS